MLNHCACAIPAPLEVRKCRKSSKNFSCNLKTHASKHGKNNKFSKRKDLKGKKAKKALEKSANVAKIFLFLRYLLARVFTLHEKFLLLLRYLRTTRGPSLPYKLQVFSFAKFVILAIFAKRVFSRCMKNYCYFSRAFFAFLPFKSFLLLNLLFLLFLRYLLVNCCQNFLSIIFC